ncbi:MAG: thioredoxin family protein, partial [Gammaproteobacteria bacterium]
GVGVLVGLYGIIMLVGAATGGADPFQPLARFSVSKSTASVTTPTQSLKFTRIKTLADLNQAVAQASREHKTVMLDFYADWCVSCREMEHGAFKDAGVKSALTNTVLLQADVTANDAQDQALLKHFGIYGPPSIMFFNGAGQELTADRVVGYMSARDFETHIHQAFGTTAGTVI